MVGMLEIEVELLHVPSARRTALGAKAAVQTHVLVLGHDTAGLEPAGYIQILRQIARWRVQSRPQVGFIAVGGEGDAIHRTDVYTGVAFDAKLRREHCLHIAIETALRFRKGLRRVKAELDLDLDVLESDGAILERHLC